MNISDNFNPLINMANMILIVFSQLSNLSVRIIHLTFQLIHGFIRYQMLDYVVS